MGRRFDPPEVGAATDVRRLGLGTAQLGLPYGIANRDGAASLTTARSILSRARAAGMDTVDTATGYGHSEETLGHIGVSEWRVVTKVPAFPESCDAVAEWLTREVEGSLRRLRLPRLYGLLLHRPAQLLSPRGEELYHGLESLRTKGLVEKVGVSIYDPSELDALADSFEFDVVQAPLSVLDRRLVTSGWLDRLHHRGTEVHARSIFLQGLLLLGPDRRPAKFERWAPLWSRLDDWLREEELDATQVCVRFALSHQQVGRVIVGVDNAAQLDEVLRAAEGPPLSVPADLVTSDTDLIDPSRWV